MIKRNPFIFLYLVCVIGNHNMTYTHTDVIKTHAHNALMTKNTFMLGLGASALLMLARWVLSESDIQLISRSEEYSKKAYLQYTDLIQLFDANYNNIPSTIFNEDAIYNATENEIYNAAFIIWNSGKNYAPYLQELIQTINQLSSILYALDVRQHKLEEELNSFSQYHEIISQMKRFIKEIIILREKLNFIKRYFIIHGSYFELFDVDGKMRNKYSVPLEYIDTLQQNYHECTFKIREWALNKEVFATPFHQIVSEIRADILELQAQIRKTSLYYQHRITTAQQLSDALKYIKSLIAIDPIYTEEAAAHAW